MKRNFVDILIKAILGFIGVTILWTGIHEQDVGMMLIGLMLILVPWAFDTIVL